MQKRFLIIAVLFALLLPSCGGDASSPAQAWKPLEIPVSGTPPLRNDEEMRAEEKSNGLVGSEPRPVMPVGSLDGEVAEEVLIGGLGGYTATPGCKATIQYAAFSRTGKKIASSWEEGKPFTFTMGRGEVIEGLEQGMVMEEPMEVDQRREFVIPPNFAKGESLGRIPEGRSLILVVDLLRIQLRTCD